MPTDTKMLENAELRQPEQFRLDERFHWYQVNHFLLGFARMGVNLGLEAADIVHLGGTANFYRLYQAFGPQAVQHFRGTHDMDIISFRQGKAQRVLDGMVADYRKEGERLGAGKVRLTRVRDYSTRPSLSLPDKRSFYVALDYRDMPGTASGFEIDVYESRGGQIRFNNRVLTKDRIIFDPAESLELTTLAKGQNRGLISVPSLRDYLILKTDIVDFSRSGLRIKDQFDILTLLKICGVLGVDFNHLVTSVVEVNSTSGATARLQELARLLKDPFSKLQNVPADYPYLPDRQQIAYASRAVQQALNKILS